MTIDIIITRVEHLYDRINSLRRDTWNYRTSLPLPSTFIEVYVSCQEIETSCMHMCASDIDFDSLNVISARFWKRSDTMVFLFFASL